MENIVMPDAVAIAQARINALKAEIKKLEAFIETYNEVLAMDSPSEEPAHMTANGIPGGGNVTPAQPEKNVEKRSSQRKSRRASGIRPSEIAEHMERIIREVGRPMTRGDIVDAFERRDIRIPYEDKARYIGTIAWRHKGVFENIEGRGYWLRGEALPDQSRTAPDLAHGSGGDDLLD